MSLGAIPSDILFCGWSSGQDKKIVTSMTDNDQSTQKVVKVVKGGQGGYSGQGGQSLE